MKKKYKIFGSSLFVLLIAFNVSIHFNNNFLNDITKMELEILSSAADPEDWNGKSDVGCVECSQPGVVQYYCKSGNTTCFQTDCVGGIC